MLCNSILLHLLASRYRLKSKLDIENLQEDFSCWQRFSGKLGDESTPEETEVSSIGWGGTVDRTAVSAAQGDRTGLHWTPLVEADEETEEGNFLLWRLEQGVAEGSNKIPKDEAIPLEYNLAGLNAISFDKGCYIGQELIARTHHRGVIRKRLVTLRFLTDNGKEAEQEVAPGSEVLDHASQKKVGEVRTAIGPRGMGVLRLEEAFKQTGTLTIKGREDIHVKAIRRTWWPVEWFMDHQQQHAAA